MSSKDEVWDDLIKVPISERKLKEGRNNFKMFSHWCRKEHEKVGEKMRSFPTGAGKSMKSG